MYEKTVYYNNIIIGGELMRQLDAALMNYSVLCKNTNRYIKYLFLIIVLSGLIHNLIYCVWSINHITYTVVIVYMWGQLPVSARFGIRREAAPWRTPPTLTHAVSPARLDHLRSTQWAKPSPAESAMRPGRRVHLSDWCTAKLYQ